MPHTSQTAQRLLRGQSVGGVRLIGRYVVWRRGLDIYAVWPESNVYSAVRPGRRYSLSQAIEVLTDREMRPWPSTSAPFSTRNSRSSLKSPAAISGTVRALAYSTSKADWVSLKGRACQMDSD